MNRLSVVAVKRAFLSASFLLVALAAPRVAMAQEADPLKFKESKPTVIGWVIRADKTADFEEAWAGIKGLLAKSDNADLKAFGQTLGQIYKIEGPPTDFTTPAGPVKAVSYIFRIDAPSTAYSYNPRSILYEYLKAGAEGSAVTRAEADALYTGKLTPAYLTINFLWTLSKVGG